MLTLFSEVILCSCDIPLVHNVTKFYSPSFKTSVETINSSRINAQWHNAYYSLTYVIGPSATQHVMRSTLHQCAVPHCVPTSMRDHLDYFKTGHWNVVPSNIWRGDRTNALVYDLQMSRDCKSLQNARWQYGSRVKHISVPFYNGN